MSRWPGRLLVFTVFLTASSVAGQPKTPAPILLRFETGCTVPIFANKPPTTADKKVTVAVVVIHGLDRDGAAQLQRILGAAAKEKLADQVLVLAPDFLTEEDKPEAGSHYWGGDWAEGGLSRDSKEKKERLSSFEVVDRLTRELAEADRFPNLKRVTIVGHSAGAQFVNRYVAVGRPAEPTTKGKPKFEYVFVAANPSSYLYLDDRRPVKGKPTFEKPGDDGLYNRWRFGLERLNDYAKQTQPKQISENVFARKTVYLIGSEDNKQDKGLSIVPGAVIQGENRHDRWENYQRYTQLFPEWKDNVRFAEVKGVGHNATGIFLSDEGRRAIFK
jgi:hypothetical protein